VTAQPAPDTLSATRRIPAAPDKVFAVLADPTTHAGVHASRHVAATNDAGRIGRVDGALDTEPITGAGQRFRMAMYHDEHPTKNYVTVNEVHVYEPAVAIAWRTGALDENGVAKFGGWLWRFDLAPAGASSTDVTLTYGWSAATQEARDIIHFPPFGQDHLRNSLDHLAEIVATTER
jgi:uncharacterized protein YndB with AHSA1/START domain